jgi:hypothetical protein
MRDMNIVRNVGMIKRTITTYILFLVLIGLISGCAGPQVVHQPRMEAALQELRAAREELERAVPNKGGHRETAIDLIDQATEQVKEGIYVRDRYAR